MKETDIVDKILLAIIGFCLGIALGACAFSIFHFIQDSLYVIPN